MVNNLSPKANNGNQYWRWINDGLTKDDLRRKIEAGGHHAVKSMGFGDLYSIAYRMDTQRPEYKKCSTDEVRTFVSNRGLLGPTTAGKTSKMQCVSLLTKADRALKFRRFKDLPPELRVRIYGYYFADFPEVLKNPTQPPLARISKAMRSEVLPAFYKNTTIEIELRIIDYSHTLHFSPESLNFLSSVPKSYFSDIGHLRINIAAQYLGTRNKKIMVTWATFDVKLGKTLASAEVTSEDVPKTGPVLWGIPSKPDRRRALQQKIEQVLRTMVKSCAEKEQKGLSLSELRKARVQMEQSFDESF